MRAIDGRCHCGNIAYRLEWPEIGKPIAVRACTCTFCTKHGGVYTSHPDARLNVHIADADHINRYAFATRTATFHVCTRCGVVPLVTSTIDGTVYGVVNVNTFENVAASDLDARPSDFDGETEEERLARRKRNWISRVQVETPG